MKPKIAEDGTRTHELTVHERRALVATIETVEQVAFHYRGGPVGDTYQIVSSQLEKLLTGIPPVVEASEDET